MSPILRNIPNILTISRIVLAAVFFIFFFYATKLENFSKEYSTYYYLAALICFFIASITDALDGFLARKLNVISKFGKLYDPLADKVLIILAFYCIYFYPFKYFSYSYDMIGFFSHNQISMIIMLILSRDFLITIFREKLKSKKVILKASYIAKAKTVIQLACIHIYLINKVLIANNVWATHIEGITFFPSYIPSYISNIVFLFEFLLIITLLLSLWSAHKYIRKNI